MVSKVTQSNHHSVHEEGSPQERKRLCAPVVLQEQAPRSTVRLTWKDGVIHSQLKVALKVDMMDKLNAAVQ